MGPEALTFTYDGPLVTAVEHSGALNTRLDFAYDATMRLASITYAGEETPFGYDQDELLTGVGSFVIERAADNGLPLAVDDGTARLERAFNGHGEVQRETLTVGGVLVGDIALTRDNAGRITAKTETIAGETFAWQYAYDAFGRLLEARRDGAVVETYAYGPQGERLGETNALRGIADRSYSYDEEGRLLTAGAASYAFDVDGFLTSKTEAGATTAYHYSSRGELKQVDLPGTGVITYSHDPLGRRIAKSVDGTVVERYQWLGRTRLLAVLNADGSLKYRFAYADGRMPVAMTTGAGRYYLTYDQVGSLRAVVDAQGSVVKRITYDSFGNVLEDTNPALTLPFGFAGGLYDPDTGLLRFGFRDYAPDTGRWTAKDPIGFAGGDTDLFLYVQSDPVNLIDPPGLIWVTVDIDNHGIRNFANIIIRHYLFADEGRAITHLDNTVGCVRDNIQEWQQDEDNPCRDHEHNLGERRIIRQTLVKKPNPLPPDELWDINSPSDVYWSPIVPSRTYDNY